uniref:NADH-ubiquinone oxidoreductase chain 5 n=1 Tax=Torymus sp. ZJUH_2016035 TaxID=2491172 RepID=A0A3S8V1F5_9HYME|nr:NADH dehydrogenase subunit 5 [Torymus sp. ZJUH_2016035]
MMFYYLSGFYYILFSLIFFFFSLFFLIFKLEYFCEWTVYFLNSVSVNMLIYVDWMTLMFIFTVLMISSMIMFYCVEYMGHDIYNIRFFYLVFFFILSMLLMILSPNIISILIGWDGLGLVSYCLVIYYQNFSSYNSGMLTVLLNRIGDVMLIISISLMFNFGSWNFLNLNYLNWLILFMVMVGAFTKSAQFPFSSWLPMAMAAPTPVSSLVHSSTLVTAGVYLLIRFNYLMMLNDLILFYIMITGLLTMLMSGFSANYEYDLKKIIAYSTLSQLGLMMMIYGLKNYELAYFHLIIHAMFKSMMFMCSGVIIHYSINVQDIRYFGKLKDLMPLTSMMFMISNLSLCGMPFMSGFYSKDQILEFMFMNNLNLMIYLILILSTGLTVSYSIRLLYYLMSSKFNFYPIFFIKDDKIMNYSMLILMLMSVIFGSMMNWILFMNIELIYLFKYEKMSIIFLCLVFFFIGFIYYYFKNYLYMYSFKYFFGKMWFLYSFNLIFLIPFNFGKFYLKLFDKGWSEYYFKNSMFKNLFFMDLLNKNLNNNYLIIMMLSFMFLMMIMLLI